MATKNYYRVLLDNEWRLEDLYTVPHALAQTYAFIYCFDSKYSPRDRERINYALQEYPWGGGYSYVNIYTVLKAQVPVDDRPRIKSISKSSPGWLELFLNVDVAVDVAKSVSAISAAAAAVAASVRSIYKSLEGIKLEREKNKLKKMQLTQAQMKTVLLMCEDMAKFLGFKKLKDLHEQTGNPEVTLKLLLAHYRRISTLSEYVKKGKISLPLDSEEQK